MRCIFKIVRADSVSSHLDSTILETITGRLLPDEPPTGQVKMASVAVIVEGESTSRILLIKRADLGGDPWSGQVAFPGGKSTKRDKDARATATRETLEEVGIDLNRDGKFLGYFRAFRTHTGTMEVVPSVFVLKRPVVVSTSDEVSSYRWVGLPSLFAPESKTVHNLHFQGEPRAMPAYRVGDYLVWGLTRRILSSLLDNDEPSI